MAVQPWAFAVTFATVCTRVIGQDWPGCIETGVVLRHAGAHAIFVDLSSFASAGCWQNDCKNTDKFSAADMGVCGRACGAIDECTHWTYGEQDGSAKCFLRKSDGGREEAQGWFAASKACAPTPLPDAFAALTAAELPELQACDNGKSEACPDIGRAIQTWRFAIEHLKRATDGQLDENTMQYVNQISSDTEAFAAQISEENFPVVAGNNRQVFLALRGWMDGQPKADVNVDDASLPNPLRGKLCGVTSCFA
mmetsp:Transcript_15413/g.33935  ORF Transcript_15413/g.33935 Transcript_15413/m.33935 type:complete len:252 (-) Transcript_15413:78-833(-)